MQKNIEKEKCKLIYFSLVLHEKVSKKNKSNKCCIFFCSLYSFFEKHNLLDVV